MTGILRIRGKIDIGQFWPVKTSDADTAKIIVTVNDGSFAFAANGKTFKTTKVFFGAKSKGKTSKVVVSTKNEITIRLQGIDAPELHYRAAPLGHKAGISDAKRKAFNAGNPERRQHWGESAAAALGKKLGGFGSGAIPCEFVTFVDHPNQVVDTYGRFIGNVRVGSNYSFDINTWLVEEGWAFPTFYSSMSRDEIEELIKAGEKGKVKKRIWKDYSMDAAKFEPKLVYRAPGTHPKVEDDSGPVLMPKLFRRQVSYRVQKSVGLVDGTFEAYLKKQPDECYTTKEFLNQGAHAAKTRKLDEFVKGAKFSMKPDELVFREAASTLLNAKGKPIQAF